MASSNEARGPKFGKRHVLALWIFLGYVTVYITRVSLNIAITTMVNQTSTQKNFSSNYTDPDVCPFSDTNDTKKIEPEFDWDRELQGVILGSFYYGYIATQFIGGFMPRIIGSRLMFGIAVCGTGVTTLLIPIAAEKSIPFLIVLRVLAGALQGVTMPCTHFISGSWAPIKERTMLVAMPLTGMHIGTVFAGVFTGMICEYLNWRYVFYIFGAVCVVWTGFWFWVVRDTPAQHPSISPGERKYIEENCGTVEKPVSLAKVPWLRIILSPPVWAIVIAQTFYNWNFDSILIEVSTYLNDVLHITATLNGVLACLPFVCACCVELSVAFLSDYLLDRGVPVVWVRKGFFTFGMLTSAAALLGITFAGCNTTVVVVLLCLAIGLTGFAFVGFVVNHVDIAPQYASILMSLTNTIAQIPGIVSPMVTAAIISGESNAASWKIFFYIMMGITASGAILFDLLASGQLQEWGKIQEEETPEEGAKPAEKQIEMVPQITIISPAGPPPPYCPPTKDEDVAYF